MNEEENYEETEILDDSSIENVDNIVPDKRDEQIANLNTALHREREQNKRLKESIAPRPVQAEEDGSIDPNVFAQNILGQTQNIIQDERNWNKALRKYPELDEDKDLERAVKGYRNSALVEDGEIITYEEAAERVIGKFKKQSEKNIQKAEEKGRTEAQTSERIQERAVLDSPSGGKENAEDIKKEEIRKVLFSPDSTDREREAAREQLLNF
jgi:deoxyribodipyrimidine photolyase